MAGRMDYTSAIHNIREKLTVTILLHKYNVVHVELLNHAASVKEKPKSCLRLSLHLKGYFVLLLVVFNCETASDKSRFRLMPVSGFKNRSKRQFTGCYESLISRLKAFTYENQHSAF